jgi:anaphase-promoting complex subunit 6
VAVSALASTEEWAVLQQFVQDLLADWFPDTGPEHDGGASDLERRLIESLAVTPTTSSIDDDLSRRDEDRRLASRVWYWRGRAHWELGDPVLATQHWSAALELDARNQAAWNALLSLQLLTPQQACELLTTRVRFARNDGWLRALYLAQIAVTQKSPEKDSSSVRPRSTSLLSLPPPLQETSPGRGALNFGDASSIQLSSPMMSPPFHLNDENNAAASSKRISAGGQLPPRGTSANADAHAQPSEPCHAKVHEAFAELTNTYRLGQSPHVMALAARRAYNCYDWKTCLSVCEQLVAQGSIVPSSAPSISSLPSVSSLSSFSDAAYCYVAVLVLLGRHRSLFSLAHEWVSAAPKSPLSWFAVGAYYYATGRYHVAQRHFCRATRLDPHCSPAWMAFGCSFAVVDESDQALASFRAAQRLAPGDALPLLYMGVEYVRTNHLPLAQHFLRCARVQSQDDPLCLHESGVLEFQRGNLESAIQWFSGALRTLSRCSALDGGASCVSVKAAVLECSDPYWEPTIFNLGHAFRKTRQFDLAKTCFERCIALTQSASAYSALAFTNHLSGEVDAAISLYHQALAVKPDDPFSSEMLGRALRESMQQGIDELLSIPATRPPASSKRLLRGHDTSSSLAVGSINKLGDESILSEGGTMDQSEDMDSDVDMNG